MSLLDDTVSKFENNFSLFGGVSDKTGDPRMFKIKFIEDYLRKFDKKSQDSFWNYVKKFHPELVKLSNKISFNVFLFREI